LFALSLAFDAPSVRWQWLDARVSGWLAVAYLGWVATVGYSLWTGLLKRHPANRVRHRLALGVPVVGLANRHAGAG
jgi:O-acetylserine/cysteine efflux transporter